MKKKQLKPTHRVHVFYSGRVQGVGFRYTVERLALELGLLGFVKNLSNGRVELVCEGQQETIERLLQLIQESRLGTHITRADSSWEKPTQAFRDFTVEFYL
jgi:acylphosphatase